MNIVFRADASLEIGSGHVMRCLTLAEALKQQGHQCHFICREHPGHLGELIEQKGFILYLLPLPLAPSAPSAIEKDSNQDNLLPTHGAWLGVHWRQDAHESLTILESIKPQWLVLDHYALDQHWQNACCSGYQKLTVIDDLADRKHRCHLLVDQTYGRKSEDYQSLVPKESQLLVGAAYALLRPEFSSWRAASLQRRKVPSLKNILVNMGGVDKDNVTGEVLDAIKNSLLDNNCNITIVMGSTAPHIKQIKALAAELSQPNQVLSGVSNMAELMSQADLAIGAAGSTAWERCCLGLPTLMIILAENQKLIARALTEAEATWSLENTDNLSSQVEYFLNTLSLNELQQKSIHAQAITDGQGIKKLLSSFDLEVL